MPGQRMRSGGDARHQHNHLANDGMSRRKPPNRTLAPVEFGWTPEQDALRQQAREVAAGAVDRFGRHNDSWINGFSKEFGGPAVVWNVGYETAHGVADYHRSHGDKARVFYEPGFGWSVQVQVRS